MAKLQFAAPADEIDRLFDSWDPDGSGLLTMDELQTLLRRGGTIKLSAKLQDGAAGTIETRSTNKCSLRSNDASQGMQASASEPVLRGGGGTLFPALRQGGGEGGAMPGMHGYMGTVSPEGGSPRLGAGVVLPPIFVSPPRRAQQPPPGAPLTLDGRTVLAWDQKLRRHVTHGEKLLGPEWRRKLHERHLFWDDKLQRYVTRGEQLASSAPVGDAAPRMARAKPGAAANFRARWSRTSAAARSHAETSWEEQVLERLEGAHPYATVYGKSPGPSLRARVAASHEMHVNDIHARFLS